MPDVLISFRSQTTVGINDFCEDRGLHCAASHKLIAELSGALLSYKEEGVEYKPDVLFTTASSGILHGLPGIVTYKIGDGQLGTISAKAILKECVPLAVSGWSMWIERTNDQVVSYGVLFLPQLPSSLLLDEAITLAAPNVALLLRREGKSNVAIKSSSGDELSLIFSTVRDQAGDDAAVITFSEDCCGELTKGEADFVAKYLSRRIRTALNQSHGTMLVCCQKDAVNHPDFEEGKLLTPPLDFAEALREFNTAASSEGLLSLQSMEALMVGLMSSDGIVCYNRRGQLTGYRAFYRGTPELEEGDAGGGARRRAFAGMKGLVGHGVQSVLFRSQDGLLLYKGLNHG